MGKDLSAQDILLMLANLEHCMHRKFIGEYEVSSNFNPCDPVSLHKEASRMLLFSGLLAYHPLVEFTNVGSNVAGDIHLNDNPTDFTLYIRLSNTTKTDERKVLCILAHEVCHKVLQFYRFPILRGLENEYYTDIATFYLGFGKLTLNGARTEEKIGNGVRTHTIGYLSDSSLSIVYNLVKAAYGTSDKGLKLSNPDFIFVSSSLRSLLSQIRNPAKVVDASGHDLYFEKFYRITCTHCGYVSPNFTPQLFGKKVRCPNCKSMIYVNHDFRKQAGTFHYQQPVLELSFGEKIKNYVSDIKNMLLNLFGHS